MKKIVFASIMILQGQFLLADICEERWAFSIKGGVSPSWFTNRRDTFFFAQPGDPVCGLQSRTRLPRFHELFKVPAYFSVEWAYAIRDDVEFFLDLNYASGSGKTISFERNDENFTQDFSSFRAFGAFVGSRYYFALRQCWMAPFIGQKFGFQHRRQITARTFSATTQEFTTDVFFDGGFAVAGSVQAGIDFIPCQYIAISVQTELQAAGPLRSNTIFPEPPNPITTVGLTGTIISFPISIGIKILF